MSKTKQTQIQALADEIVSKKICPQLAKTATQLVMGGGSLDAEVMFIGEAPGKQEDLQGLPFVGAAGKLLDEMLEAIGLKRQDVYISNIVKYRPPENRDPLPEEILAFMPYLGRQIAIIKPKLIVTLGRFSTNVFLPEIKISQAHGQPKRIRRSRLETGIWTGQAGHQDAVALPGDSEQRTQAYKQYGGGAAQRATPQRPANASGVGSPAGKQASESLVILPLYHPAVALYNGSLRQTLHEDFAKILPTIEAINNESKTTKNPN